jgi:hypothetical protein
MSSNVSNRGRQRDPHARAVGTIAVARELAEEK